MKKRPISFSIGTSSIPMAFVLLCLVTFAALSYASSSADERLSATLRDRVTAYYQATDKAERWLAEVDASLSELYEQTDSETDYLEQAAALYSLDDEGKLSKDFPLESGQQLHVQLEITYPGEEHPHAYRILTYLLEQTEDWEEDDSLNLMPFGETE